MSPYVSFHMYLPLGGFCCSFSVPFAGNNLPKKKIFALNCFVFDWLNGNRLFTQVGNGQFISI